MWQHPDAHSSPLCEPLESRQLLAFTLTDYYPMAGGNSWSYSGTENGLQASSAMTSTEGVAESGLSTTRFETQFVSSPSLSRTSAIYDAIDSQGLRRLRGDITLQGITTITRFTGGGVILVPLTVVAGQVYSFSAPYTSGSGGNAGFGQVSGTKIVSGPVQIVTPAGTFAALKITESTTDTGQINGVMYTSTSSSSSWLVEGLGGVRAEISVHTIYSNGAPDFFLTTEVSLTSATLLRPVISLSGNNLVIAHGDTTPRTADGSYFGSTGTQQGSQVRSFTITNNGPIPLNFGSDPAVTISGPNANRFAVLAQPVGPLVPGASRQFSIRFTPFEQVGLSNATVSIASSDPVTSAYSFAIQGNGLAFPQAQLSGNQVNIDNGDTTPSTADGSSFAEIDGLYGAEISIFTITNNGLNTLNFGTAPAVTISGINANRFVALMQPTGPLAPGASTQFSVRFAPGGQLGLSTATVSIANNDPARSNYTFAIQGKGLALPRAQVSGNRANIENGDATPTTADWSKFAGIDALYGNKVRIFTITNTGLNTLNLGAAPTVTISGPDADRFVVFVQPASSLAPGASTQFRVRFTPGGQVGFANATISIASNDPATPIYTFNIQGNGLALARAQVYNAGIAIAPGNTTPNLSDKTDFGAVAASGTNNRVRLFTLTNIGLASLTLTGLSFVTITGSNASDFTVSAQPTTNVLAPGQSVTFRVRFDPTHTGPCSAVVVLGTNENVNFSPSAGRYSFAIAGVGV